VTDPPPELAHEQGPDLRLLPGALTAWAVTAATLAAPPWWRVGAAAALSLSCDVSGD